MKFSFCWVVFLSVWAVAGCDLPAEGVLQMECHDSYFMIAIDLPVAEQDFHFEAVDSTGVYPLTEQYAAECGYSINVLPFLGYVEFRASYLSCHAEKKGNLFEFKINLIRNLEGKVVTHALNRTCSPLPWSPREVFCEVNYMEVTVQHEPTCQPGASDWNTLRPVYVSPVSDWQVAFHKPDDQQLQPMNFTEARKQGYVVELIYGRILFRTPYGQPDSYSTEMNGVPVEVVHASIFSRQSWFVVMVDLFAACSMSQGSFAGGYLTWKTPETLYSSRGSMKVSLGLNGDLVEQEVAEQRGFIVNEDNSTLEISIPYKAKGGYRKSHVSGGLFVFYLFNLYVKQISMDGETVVRSYRTLDTPLLPHLLVTEDQTVLQDGVFTVFLGNVPDDVELTSIQLNGQQFKLPLPSDSTFMITEEVQPENTYSYTLKMLFSDPLVIQEFSKEHAAMLHQLNINYTLMVPGGSEPYHYTTSVTALLDVSPPAFEANCTASGITFMLVHQPSDYLWEFSIGTDLLTMELVTRRGYMMSNNSQTLVLTAPLHTPGYVYRDVSLQGFYGTFEILVRDHNTSRVRASTIKTCFFESREFIMCSTDGMMTVAADLSGVIPSGQMPVNFHLYNKLCVPNEVNGTRVLFSIPINSCGSVVKLRGNVTYRNKIFYTLNNLPSDEVDQGVTVQCSYPLHGLSRLFSVYRFESDTEGKGTIIHDVQTTPVVTNTEPTPEPQTTTPTTTTAAPQKTIIPNYLPAHHPPAHYIRVTRVHSLPNVFYRGSKGYFHAKQNPIP